MARSSKRTEKFGKVVVKVNREANVLEIFRGYGVLSRKGIVLEAYADDFQYATSRLSLINDNLLTSRKSKLVRVVAVVEWLSPKEIRQLVRDAKKTPKGD
jgi:hypothetical protein